MWPMQLYGCCNKVADWTALQTEQHHQCNHEANRTTLMVTATAATMAMAKVKTMVTATATTLATARARARAEVRQWRRQ